MKSMILRAAGTNCDGETEVALRMAGSEVERVHVNLLIEKPELLDDVQLLVFPGGFSFGDDVASGAVMAYTLEKRLRDQIDAYVSSGRRVLGVCNGFQVLVRMGLLPGDGNRAALLPNLSGRFEDRWVRLKAEQKDSAWFAPGQEYLIPVAHAEGRFEYYANDDSSFPESQIAVTYVADKSGAYPANPNGSVQDIAGVTNPQGNVLGLMPHPERFVRPTHHPYWTRYRVNNKAPSERDLPVPLGLDMFRRVVETKLD